MSLGRHFSDMLNLSETSPSSTAIISPTSLADWSWKRTNSNSSSVFYIILFTETSSFCPSKLRIFTMSLLIIVPWDVLSNNP